MTSAWIFLAGILLSRTQVPKKRWEPATLREERSCLGLSDQIRRVELRQTGTKKIKEMHESDIQMSRRIISIQQNILP